MTYTKYQQPSVEGILNGNQPSVEGILNDRLQYHNYQHSKLNQTNNPRTTPPISGDDIIGNLLHNQMILTPV